MTDEGISEIYLMCLGGKANGIPVHIFPCRMEGEEYKALVKANPEQETFWRELEPIYSYFKMHNAVPRVKIDKSGTYKIATQQ